MNLFASSLFLLFTIGTISGRDLTPAQIVQKVNEQRKQLANKYQIANMQKLVLDDRMMDAASRERKKCAPTTSNGADFQMMSSSDVRNININPDDLFKTRSIPEGIFLGSSELYIPTVSQIGIVNGKCNGTDHGIAAFGPGTTWSYSDFKSGPPGSACDAGQNAVDGLCVGKRSSAGEEANKEPTSGAEGDSSQPEPLNGRDPEDHLIRNSEAPPKHSESTTAASSSSNSFPILQRISMFLLAVLFL